MAQVEGPKLSSGDSTDWIVTSDVSMLKVPSVPPSRLDGCKIIDIGYHIKVSGQLFMPLTRHNITYTVDICIYIHTILCKLNVCVYFVV